MKVNFNESGIPELYSQALCEKGMVFSANYAYMIGWISMAAVGDILRNTISKEKNKPVAFVFKNETGDIICGAIVKFRESEDKDHPEGNFEYVWSFDPADFTDDMNVADLSNSLIQPYFVMRAGDKFGMEYMPGKLHPMHVIFFEVLKGFLSDNAKADEETEIVLDNVFSARSIIEDGQLALSIEPLGKMVQLIKDDKALEQQ